MSIDPRDVRDKRISFRPATPEQKTRIDAAARDAGVSASTWIRDLLVGETGYEDMARRRAVQRPRQRRPEETGNAPPIIRVSEEEITAIEAEAARLGISVSDLARIVIEAELQHQEEARKRAARAARRAKRRRDVIAAELDRQEGQQ